MLRHTAILFMALAMSSAALAQNPPANEPVAPPAIMVLGTFHFTGGGSDYVNSPVVDYLSPERQAEIATVLDRLETFAPTRILVELPPEHESEFNATYRRYRAGEGALAVNERQQIGLALAARLDLDQVYAVDYASEMDFGGMFAAAEAAGQDDLLAGFNAFMAPIQAQLESPDQAARPVLDRLIETNSAEMAGYHALYLLTAQMGAADNPVGAEQMQVWWGRNLHIFANIARLAGPGERVLVVYGAGHKYLLDQFIDSAPNLELIDPLAYLD
ncbi:DUF5694 domain-containing protein [Maricaulis sp.]|uniref:DUF5694 domain-containing protein n=1 Tax=Maricaulis sp. TaxID=1486257 RepID=UPI003A929CC7